MSVWSIVAEDALGLRQTHPLVVCSDHGEQRVKTVLIGETSRVNEPLR